MHISSLPSRYGIGTMGDEARKFADFLKEAGQLYWQVLPIGPTSFGDSPYQSFSTFAGNLYFIDLEYLCRDGLLTEEECRSYEWGDDPEKADYGILYVSRGKILRKAFERFEELDADEEYSRFCSSQQEWLEDYAIFMTLKDLHKGAPWHMWEDELKCREEDALLQVKAEYAEDIEFWKFVQFLFFRQWNDLKKYVNEKGLQLIGDIPIYVSMDSSDVWANPDLFWLDEELAPVKVAGCPPDAFSSDGQLWGNPLFRWDRMETDGFQWWTNRVEHLVSQFDMVRIDHFRGFESYYAIPAGDKNARRGEWKKGPGLKFFETLEKKLGKLPIIVEDLGFLTPEVLQMVHDSGYPGMKLMQFAFDGRDNSLYLPHNHIKHCVVYTGSHDNDTIIGWYEHAPEFTAHYAKEYMRLNDEEGVNWGMMKTAWASVADTAIVTMQDLLGLGSEARMNTPSTTGGNWEWRMLPGSCTHELAQKVRENMLNYVRLH